MASQKTWIGQNGESYRRVGGVGGWVDEATENPTMTAVTRAQHAKPWKSFPASSKTFMEFSQHIQRHSEGGEVEQENSLSLSLPPTHPHTLLPLFYYEQPLFLSRLGRGETGCRYLRVGATTSSVICLLSFSLRRQTNNNFLT